VFAGHPAAVHRKLGPLLLLYLLSAEQLLELRAAFDQGSERS
jgi:hypothetical protein